MMGVYSYEIYLTQGYLQNVVRTHPEQCLLIVASIIGIAVLENRAIEYIRGKCRLRSIK